MDRISGLSDELLLKILMLVPTKVAVSTSILSKRWEYLWMWLPRLKYDSRNCSEPECERLQSFLDRNLPLHRAPVIESFSLGLFTSRFKPESVNMWLLNAVYHKVRELDIYYEFHPANPNILPSNLFTCNSLVILKLEGGGILLDVPRMVSLPSLKSLKLQIARFFNDQTLQRLLSSCPILEDLVLNLDEEDTTQKLTVAVPSLQNLSLFIPYDHEIDGFVIKTPALKYFILKDNNYRAHYCLVEHMPNLIEAHFDVVLSDIKSLIGSITSVKRLSICSETIFDDFVFDQLEHLKLCLCKEHFSNQLSRLLKASSKLKTLHLFFMNSDHYLQQEIHDWNEPSTVPECMLSSLQSLSWSEYTGEPQEREVVVYILKHALHLKTATIKSNDLEVPKFEMLKELALSPRASAICQLMFD